MQHFVCAEGINDGHTPAATGKFATREGKTMRQFARQFVACYSGPLVLTCALLTAVLVCG